MMTVGEKGSTFRDEVEGDLHRRYGARYVSAVATACRAKGAGSNSSQGVGENWRSPQVTQSDGRREG